MQRISIHVDCDVPPRLTNGVELVGDYQGSGLVEAAHLVRRPDGGIIAISPLLWGLLAGIDGTRTINDLSAWLSPRIGRSVVADDVAYLVEHKLQPLGVLAAPAGADAQYVHATPRPLLGLTVRHAAIPRRVVERASKLAAPLFTPGVLVAVLVAFVAMDAWLVSGYGLPVGVAGFVGQPRLVLLVLALTVASGAFHELGHGAAAAYGGARPGAVGVGVYLIWPAFFSEMTDSYRLSRASRVRVDLGGVYFNVVYMLLLLGAYGITRQPALLAAIGVQHVLALKQFVPFLRFDGYYLACDLTGVPDLFSRMRPMLAGLIRGRFAGADLKPKSRALVAAWVLTTAGLMTASVTMLLLRLSRISTTTAAFVNHQATLVAELMRGDPHGVAGLLRLAGLAIPVTGLLLPLVQAVLARRARRVTRPVWWAQATGQGLSARRDPRR